MRIEPFPLPRIGVFMNKVCDNASNAENIRAEFLDSWIPERVGVKRAITSGGVPSELVDPFKKLWNEIVGYLA